MCERWHSSQHLLTLQALLGGSLLAPLLRLLADSVEAVREADAQLLSAMLGRVPDAPALMPAVAAALALRLSGAVTYARWHLCQTWFWVCRDDRLYAVW